MSNAGVSSVGRRSASCFCFLTKPDHNRPDYEDNAKGQEAFAIRHDKRVRLNRSLKHSVGLLQRPGWISRMLQVLYGLVR